MSFACWQKATKLSVEICKLAGKDMKNLGIILYLIYIFFSNALGTDEVDEKKNLIVRDGKICKIQSFDRTFHQFSFIYFCLTVPLFNIVT